MSKPISAIMIGAGGRGFFAYGPYALAHPEALRFVAVAEPHDVRRARFADAHGIPPERQYRTWEDLLAAGQIADTALVCTLDQLHVGPTLAALAAGYDVLLEKPMATSLADCVTLVQAAEKSGRLLQICHVLRYSVYFSTIHDLVASGRLGDIVTVEHRENVVYWHMAHSFVRGNWRNSQLSSPMILAKCCHDMDLLYWNLGPCRRLNSFGSLKHYRPENAPPGAPERCTDGCPAADGCPWYAPRLYLDLVPLAQGIRAYSPVMWQRLGAAIALDLPALVRLGQWLARGLNEESWPVSAISEDSSREARLHALQTGPYGRCVYHCDNDVVDHQTVNMEMESGVSVAMVMQGHSCEEGRTMRYDGTRATLRGRFVYGAGDAIEVHDHRTGRIERVKPHPAVGSHGGGDSGIMGDFVRTVRDHSTGLTCARESLESHLMAFAAEQARLEGTVVDMEGYRAKAEHGA